MKLYATLFAALADVNRLRLLHLMRDGEICVCFLQGALATNQPKISRHLAYLRRAGLVRARPQGKWMHYSLRKQPLPVQRILTQALNAISNEEQIVQDSQRAKEIACSPSAFGLSDPVGLATKGDSGKASARVRVAKSIGSGRGKRRR